MSSPVPMDLGFLRSGLSISMAAADSRGIATLCRVLGCHFEDGGRVLNLMVDRDQAAEALVCIETTRRVAVTFSHPISNRTLQFKGCDAQVVPVQSANLDLCRVHTRDFAAVLAVYGWTQEYMDTLLDVREGHVVCVRFSPEAAFEQTPGPQAGVRMEPGT